MVALSANAKKYAAARKTRKIAIRAEL